MNWKWIFRYLVIVKYDVDLALVTLFSGVYIRPEDGRKSGKPERKREKEERQGEK